MLTRRQWMAAAGAASAWSAFTPRGARALAAAGARADLPPGARRLGGAPTAFQQQMRAAREAGAPPFDLMEHCHALGLTGLQANPPSRDPGELRTFRRRLDAYGLYLVCDPKLPATEADVPAFEAEVLACIEAGAVLFHAAMTGRRYEDFDAFEPWKLMFEANQQSVALAEPVLRKHRIRLAIENHKGWRAAEQAAWLRRLGSEWVGVAFDFGNNLSLCEDPAETLALLAPYASMAHVKDMALEAYDEGFLLSEVPLGEGVLDLPGIVATLRRANPDVLFELEMITRDPLKIPIYAPKYWATFDDRVSPIPGRDVAKVMALAHGHPSDRTLPRVAGLAPRDAAALEDRYNRQCITYARERLGL